MTFSQSNITVQRGIDVSHHNGVIDWPSAAALGVTFAFAKATEGGDPSHSSYTDQTFATNWQAMRDAGVIRGAYHFIGLPLAGTPMSQWNDDLHRQIDHFLQTVGPLEPGDLPPALDLEDGDSPVGWRQLIQSDRAAALAIVRELILYTTLQIQPAKPIIYTGSFWWSELGDPDPVIDNMPFGDYPLWFAQYPKVHTPAHSPVVLARSIRARHPALTNIRARDSRGVFQKLGADRPIPAGLCGSFPLSASSRPRSTALSISTLSMGI
jgi:GH25 family lysozyme M1 (1,4-beta-N-acetylmuramidase)